MSPLACLFPTVCVVSVQSPTTFVAALTEIPQAGSGPIRRHSDQDLASW
jgi:hypothetical protein